ncbi:MAG: DNA repair protein RecN, partial [Deltaproteobacteria bacterium]|nr:DNA repair protein RecN [Deltaproteobacteria bacterium]
DDLENFEDRLARKEKESALLTAELGEKASLLSEARKTAAVTLEKKIQRELAELSMPGVVFSIKVISPGKPDGSLYKSSGFDEVRFDFAPNKGEPPRPLSRIVSGGELSRVLLAIKQVLGARPWPMTCIFDEVDSGIGGAVAFVVGKKLKAMAQSNQVLCVTHLPQVASHANRHYVITKGVKNRRTFTEARPLERTEREEEIARMLGGIAVTAKTKEHAREMLRSADK